MSARRIVEAVYLAEIVDYEINPDLRVVQSMLARAGFKVVSIDAVEGKEPSRTQYDIYRVFSVRLDRVSSEEEREHVRQMFRQEIPGARVQFGGEWVRIELSYRAKQELVRSGQR